MRCPYCHFGLDAEGEWCEACAGTGLARARRPFEELDREELEVTLAAVASALGCYSLVPPRSPAELVEAVRSVTAHYDQLRDERAALGRAWAEGDQETVERIATDAYLGVL